MASTMSFHICLCLFLFWSIPVHGGDAEERSADSSGMLLLVSGLLVLAVLTIWLLKVKKIRFIHETGLCLLYGMIAGVIIKYTETSAHRKGVPVHVNLSAPPLTLWASFADGKNYSYERKDVLHPDRKGKGLIAAEAVFDPEVFFYALLPPIIFFAGYDMKKRFFFRNLGAILTFAFIGTTISCVVFGGLMYAFVKIYPSWYPGFRFHECLIFGSLISATDPVTILAIFQDLNVEVDLYAMVFGESVMNDAVAIVLYRSILSYEKTAFSAVSFFKALGSFVGIFAGSFVIGCVMGLGTALLTKLTKIGQFPRLETALFTLMSYSTFLIAEMVGLTGIVTVLFCGIVQAHYTYNNLTKESQVATKEIFGLLNFLAENFIFLYMGLTVFTFEDHQWDVRFIAWTFLACAISRACNIYPLSFLLNIKRSKKIKYKLQHMLWFGGLRGAVAFALAIRNTKSIPRQLILTSVLVVAIATVVFNGSLTTQVLRRLGIRVNVDPNEGIVRGVSRDEDGQLHEEISYERSWLVRKWHEFDVKYMKTLFTTKRVPVDIDWTTVHGEETAVSEEVHEPPVDTQMERPEEITSHDEEMIDLSLNDNQGVRM